MTRFLLVRHATTEMVGRALSGRTPGVHLDQPGRAQAMRLAERLRPEKIAAIYSSPLERAVETAEPVAAASKLTIQRMDALAELDFGQWTGRTFASLDSDPHWGRFNTYRSTTPAPGGEWMLQVQFRFVAALQSLCEKHAGETVLVVSHADAIRAALAHYLGIALDLFQRIEISPASITAIQLDSFGPKILKVNDTESKGDR